MSKLPTRFVRVEARDVMNLQTEVQCGEACVRRRSDMNEKRAAERLAAKQNADCTTEGAVGEQIETIRG